MKSRYLVACMGMTAAASALAQDNLLLAQAYDAKMGNEVVVTASRSPQELKDTLASTTVITREQIDQSQARNMFQLLRTVPGVYMRRNGGRGSSNSISLRGGNAGSTLVLMDGVKIESATLGQTALEQISLDQVERVEILRGPKSSLYGSTAMSGVIQIFTRKSSNKNGVSYSLGGGTDNTVDGSVSVSGHSETSRFNVTASHVAGDGFDSSSRDDERANVSDAVRFDDDAYRRSAVSLNVDQDFGELFTGNVIVNRSEGENEYDSTFRTVMPYQPFETLMAATSLTFDNDVYRSKLQYSQLKDRNETRDDTQYLDDFIETKRTAGLWENSVEALEELTLNFGADYTHDELDALTPYAVDKRDNFGGYANTRTDISIFIWDLGFRHDNNEQFGSKWTGDTAFGVELADGVTTSISYGTAFKAPSFNDLYYPFSGNPDLLPEDSESYEWGLDAYRDWGVASAHVYKSYVENLIAWAPDATGNWTPRNVNEVKIRGAEFLYGTNIFDIDWKATFTYEKVTDVATGIDLVRKPRQRAALDVDKALGAFSIGTTIYGQSGALDTVDGELQRLSGYGLVDLRAAWQVTPEVKLRGRIDNLFDKEYVEVIGYNNEGRFFMVFVDYTPR